MSSSTSTLESLFQALRVVGSNLIFIIPSFLTVYFLYARYSSPLRRIPGPFLASGSIIPRLLVLKQGRAHSWDQDQHKKFGPIVRIGPAHVAVSKPEAISQIYGVKTKFYKSQFFLTFSTYDEEGLVPDPFVLREREMHTRMRRSGANAFALKSLPSYEKNVDKVIQRFIANADQKYVDRPCDFGRVAQNVIADSIFAAIFGNDQRLIETDDSNNVSLKIERYMNWATITGVIPWIHRYFLQNMFVFMCFIATDNMFQAGIDISLAALARIRSGNVAADVPEEGYDTMLRKLAFLQHDKPDLLKDREMMIHTYGGVIAGSDTSSTALRSIFYFLLKNPETYSKLCDEIRGSGFTVPVSFADASSLPYLGAVIREALRIHSPVGMMLPRSVPAGGVTIDGYYLPAGTEVGISPWVLHHDPNVFPNPERFYPDRWLTKDAEALVRMNRSFFAFGHGIHTCIGQHMSSMMLTKIIASMLLAFDLEFVNPNENWHFTSRFFTYQHGINVRFRHIKSKA
ncbi:cytochrome P450 oxidoreductase [Cucurbitaria berberidis CBS 394.84]|uniref:Cytochrome P450 oxidoreductase n=1 Tax=Cucurbitaria berberidis CBS 394.84 TaxID=1168544 RepID=A0A9P4GDQ1_9PLEO|nr:cytochrome P450 oxidoreductase [Cucurbitaria berberidis CBS 394.84]KAF1843690.1 cytochrome P450 oxidoreductase [Cucurbitaria berberidis CBS 394.84]